MTGNEQPGRGRPTVTYRPGGDGGDFAESEGCGIRCMGAKKIKERNPHKCGKLVVQEGSFIMVEIVVMTVTITVTTMIITNVY